MQVLTAQLLFEKPEDPREFLVEMLETMKAQGAKPLLTDSDLETMFGMFDVTRRGVLTRQQAYRALKTILGAQHHIVQERAADSEDSTSLLTKEQFVSSLSSALKNAMPKLPAGDV